MCKDKVLKLVIQNQGKIFRFQLALFIIFIIVRN